MPMMTDQDWGSYRERAGQETANLNRAPFVLDPASLTGDRAQNQETFYGAQSAQDAPLTGANIAQTINKAFQDFYGRPADNADIAAWTARAKEGSVTADQLAEFIAASSRDPRNASVLGGGAGAGRPEGMSTVNGVNTFTGGLMAKQPTGNAMSGGFGGAGIMGGSKF